MNKRDIGTSYARSLLWVALFMAIAVATSFTVHFVFVDVIHGNPYRALADVLVMMLVALPIFCVIAIIATFLVFALPQLFQAALTVVSIGILARQARFAGLLALPLTAVATWYCYDYLTPTDFFTLGINAGPDWVPFQHGLSRSRYLWSAALQGPVTLFGFLYLDIGLRGGSKRPLLLAALAISVLIGGVCGYATARDQYQFL
jgi:hypothetical protein